MCIQEKCKDLCPHPVLCGAILGLAAVSVTVAVIMIKKHEKELKKAACRCADNLCEAASDTMEKGAEAFDNLADKLAT